MDIFDKILLGLFLFFVVIISFSTFVYYKVSQKKFNNVFTRYSNLNKFKKLYNENLIKCIVFYKDNIEPTERKIQHIRDKIPTATITEYMQYSIEIEKIKNEIKEKETEYKNYQKITNTYKEQLLLEIEQLPKKEFNILKNYYDELLIQ